jgi:hypothetical protein
VGDALAASDGASNRVVAESVRANSRLKSIGVYLAQAVLSLTGNHALAASLRLLPKAARLPVRIVVEGKSAHLEFLTEPSEWDRWAAETLDLRRQRRDTSQLAETS